MIFTARELAEICRGTVSGDAGVTISGAASLAEATSGEITFYGNPRYLAAFRKTRASAAFVPEDFEEQVVGAQIRVADPTQSFRASGAPVCAAADHLPGRDSSDARSSRRRCR